MQNDAPVDGVHGGELPGQGDLDLDWKVKRGSVAASDEDRKRVQEQAGSLHRRGDPRARVGES